MDLYAHGLVGDLWQCGSEPCVLMRVYVWLVITTYFLFRWWGVLFLVGERYYVSGVRGFYRALWACDLQLRFRVVPCVGSSE